MDMTMQRSPGPRMVEMSSMTCSSEVVWLKMPMRKSRSESCLTLS